MNLYDSVGGIVLILGGTFTFLAATGRIEIVPSDSLKSKQWRDKHGSYLTWVGPVIILSGILQFLGVW